MTDSKCSIFLIRHEKRNDDGLYDCSLTPDGMYRADTELSGKLLGDDTIKYLDVVNIYCSPTLRTIQTIIPFIKGCVAKNKIPSLMFDDSISEVMHNNIKHYFTMKHKPRIMNASPYAPEIDILMDIIQFINAKDYVNSRKYTKFLISHLRGVMDDIVSILNKNLVYFDKQLNNVNCNDDMSNEADAQVICELCDAEKKLESFGVNEFIDKKYTQLVDLNTLYSEEVSSGCTEETIAMVCERTKVLVQKMISDQVYKNALYISHNTVISAIVYNIYQIMYGPDQVRETLIDRLGPGTDEELQIQFVNTFNTNQGTIRKITIDFSTNKIDLVTV